MCVHQELQQNATLKSMLRSQTGLLTNSLVNLLLAFLAAGAAGLGVLGPERQVVGGHIDGQSLKVGFLAPFRQVKTFKP